MEAQKLRVESIEELLNVLRRTVYNFGEWEKVTRLQINRGKAAPLVHGNITEYLNGCSALVAFQKQATKQQQELVEHILRHPEELYQYWRNLDYPKNLSFHDLIAKMKELYQDALLSRPYEDVAKYFSTSLEDLARRLSPNTEEDKRMALRYYIDNPEELYEDLSKSLSQTSLSSRGRRRAVLPPPEKKSHDSEFKWLLYPSREFSQLMLVEHLSLLIEVKRNGEDPRQCDGNAVIKHISAVTYYAGCLGVEIAPCLKSILEGRYNTEV